MRIRLGYASILAVMAGVAMAQDAPPGSAAPAPAPPASTAPTPAPPVLEYTGKPLLLPLRCTEEDVTALGLTCSEDDPCPVFLELTTVDAAGLRIFAAGNLHAASVTMFSVLLGSEDGGKTWREPHDRIRGAALETIQFADAETAWVSGESPDPLPSNPFLLLTTDGGRTFRKKPVFGEDAENHLGTVQQFYFSTKTTGSLVVDRGQGSDGDRYETYESPNGGETWGIKESSTKPARLRRPEPESPVLRLRADGPTQAFQLERRSGTRWTPVAAFAVKVGVCSGK